MSFYLGKGNFIRGAFFVHKYFREQSRSSYKKSNAESIGTPGNLTANCCVCPSTHSHPHHKWCLSSLSTRSAGEKLHPLLCRHKAKRETCRNLLEITWD